ncbi:MAG: AI-2E family transporter [Litorimonas sp.]
MTIDTSVRTSILFMAAMAVVTALYLTRHIMTPLALAIFFWLIIDAFARFLDRLSTKFPYWLALSVAMFTVVLGIICVVLVVVDTATDIAREAPRYQTRIASLFTWLSDITGRDNLSFTSLDEQFGLTSKLQKGLAGFAAAIQSVLSSFMLIALYVAFLFAAQSSFPKKLDDLFPDPVRRMQAAKVGERIRSSIEKYIGVQTIISLLQTVISYIGMTVLGLDNALFWALVIFILNYIPIIGGLAAVALPCIFALVEFDSMGRVAILAGVLFGAQTVIGNTIQPKMMGDSMNLSALVVVLSLSLWGALWGGVGAFLSAPLTVIIMIILAQFPTTRWIAVLLSADGEPDLDAEEKKKKQAIPSM